jgi:FtsP/CotA-like multicopper oxidase with cupredoxin domain
MTGLSRRYALISGAASGAMTALKMPPVRANRAARTALPIPHEIRADGQGVIAFSATPGTVHLLPGRPTPTFGYNGPFLGPALRMRRGHTVKIDFTNHLTELRPSIGTAWSFRATSMVVRMILSPRGDAGDPFCRSTNLRPHCGSIHISIPRPPPR